MANQKIHEYLNTATSVADQDYFDMDQFDGVNYSTAKISGQDLRSSLNVGKYSQTDPSADKTGTIYQSILSGVGEGSLTVPANTFKKGDTYICELHGIMSSANNEDIYFDTFGGVAGATLLTSTGAIKLATTSDKVFSLKIKFAIHEIGAAGVADIHLYTEFIHTNNASAKAEIVQLYDDNTTLFDTTVANTLDIKVKFSTTNGSNKARSIMFTLFKVY